MAIVFPKKLELANLPTPLQPLKRFSKEMGMSTIWVKRDDLTGSVLSGNKVRKLEFTLAEAMHNGSDIIITLGGIQSNHCRATSLLCAQLGVQCHLLLYGDEIIENGNLLLDKLAGAKISYYPSDRDKGFKENELKKWHRKYLDESKKPYSIPEGASDAVGLWGYIGASKELFQDFQKHGINPGHIISATGSGGTQGGLILGKHIFDLQAKIWGINVANDAAHFINKITYDMRIWREKYKQDIHVDSLKINMIDGFVGPGYAKAPQEVFDLIWKLAETEGLVLDPVYTGKAFYGMVQKMKDGLFKESEDIVFLHTGGVFGLFPQSEEILKTKSK